jgi:hypothetical protein
MKAWTIAGILVAVAGLLVSSAAGYDWWVDHEITDCDTYSDHSEGADAGSDYGGPDREYASYAYALAQIEGEQQNEAGAAYAYVYWTDTIMGYDPNRDPPLLAHVTLDAYTKAYASGDLGGSDYDATAAAHGYVNGYRVDPYVLISEPEDGDINTDFLPVDIDIYENGYPIYLREFAYTTAETLSTGEYYVYAEAYADVNSVCVVEQNP